MVNCWKSAKIWRPFFGRKRARGSPWIRNFSKAINARNFGEILARLWRQFRPYVRTSVPPYHYHHRKTNANDTFKCVKLCCPRFFCREVSSPTAFKKNEKKFWRQQNTESIYVTNSGKQARRHIINSFIANTSRILKWNHYTTIRCYEALDFSSWGETFGSLNDVKQRER